MTDFNQQFCEIVHTLAMPSYKVAKCLGIPLATVKLYLSGALVPEDAQSVLDKMRAEVFQPTPVEAAMTPEQFREELEDLLGRLRWMSYHACQYLHTCADGFGLWRRGKLSPPPLARTNIIARLHKALAEGRALPEGKPRKPRKPRLGPRIPPGWLSPSSLAERVGISASWARELARRWALPKVSVGRFDYFDATVFCDRYEAHIGDQPANFRCRSKIAPMGDSILDCWPEVVHAARRQTLLRLLGAPAKVAALLLALCLHAPGQERPPFVSHPRPIPRQAATPDQVAQAIRENNATLRQVRARFYQRNPYPTHPRERGRHIDALAMAARRGPWAARRRSSARQILLEQRLAILAEVKRLLQQDTLT